jgi:hypothetical protein
MYTGKVMHARAAKRDCEELYDDSVIDKRWQGQIDKKVLHIDQRGAPS